jgi:hypothetical protein
LAEALRYPGRDEDEHLFNGDNTFGSNFYTSSNQFNNFESSFGGLNNQNDFFDMPTQPKPSLMSLWKCMT